MSEHTKGPLVAKSHPHPYSTLWYVAARDCIGERPIAINLSEADARLYAAAPDLLAACMAALEPAGDTPDEVRQQLRDAIDLALGTADKGEGR